MKRSNPAPSSTALPAAALALALAFMAPSAHAEEPAHGRKPLVIYDDGLGEGWQNWSWATVTLGVPVGNAKPIKVEGKSWEALALHHDPFSTKGYSKLTFVINGGVQGGQQLTVRLTADKVALDGAWQVTPKARTWAVAEIPLKELKGIDREIDGLSWQAGDGVFPAWYITRIQLE